MAKPHFGGHVIASIGIGDIEFLSASESPRTGKRDTLLGGSRDLLAISILASCSGDFATCSA